MVIPAAPSAPPSSVRVTDVTSSTITVQWGMVPCIHQNGPITGYPVRYGVMGSGSSQTETVSGASVTEVTLSSLLKYTNYSVQVAAVNSADTGVFSEPVLQVTNDRSKADHNFCIIHDSLLCVVPLVPSDVTAVQDGPTSIRVSWTPSSDATGYMIHYTSSRGDSGSEDVSGGHSDSHTLTGLVKEDTYTISIMATSHTLSSSPITVEITLSEEDPLIQLLILFSLFPVPAPGVVSVSVSSIAASSISLSWSVASGSVASWEVVWRETDRGTESSSGSLTGTSYTIDQLESTTIYTVTVRASNVAGTTDSQPITFSTGINSNEHSVE